MEGDDFNEPICDAVRSMLDGHIILSRQLQASGHYPAIDVLNSISRLSTQIARDDQQCSARKLREAMAIYARSEDLIQLGAHVQGANPTLDASIRARGQILNFLRQQDREYSTVDATLRDLHAVASLLS